MTTTSIEVTVNGEAIELAVSTEVSAVDLLRETLRLTGTKVGCSVGVCGLCTILVDGDPMSGCLLPAVLLDGRHVTTIEGLSDGEDLTPLQNAFITEGGFQCGICTPGQIVAATALLEDTSTPTDEEIREWMKGNLCRCTGYEGIVRAIRRAASAEEPPR